MPAISARKLPAAARAEVKMLAELMAEAKPTPFRYQGVAIYVFRSRRCLAGWRYNVADEMARAIVALALRRVRATRPDWAEGQPTYAKGDVYHWPVVAAQDAPTCATCRRPILDTRDKTRRRWCSPLCQRIGLDRDGAEFVCECCAASFRRRWAPGGGYGPRPRYCGKRCQMRHRGEQSPLRAAILQSTDSIAATARRLGCSKNTVRAWRRQAA